ncbi:MAG: DNA-processing protein DprA [Spirochaetaceae bacterium]|nr:DNA-processing protein DprA [Spirochaetaceae bacterium]
MTHKRDLVVALSRMSFLSCGQKIVLLNNLDNLSKVALLSIEELKKLSGKNLDKTQWNPDLLLKQVEKDLSLMEQYKIDIVSVLDEDFPPLLKEIKPVPFALYFRGNIGCLKKPCVGVVGTRHPDTEGMKAAFDFSEAVAKRGGTVVSGLALGIDAAAHKGALAVESEQGEIGSTVAFLGSGIDTIYPSGNKSLAGRILRSGGCVLSEYPLGTPALAYHFPERNRLISGVSIGVMVIEALEKSGSLITVDYALDQNRDVFFHPVSLGYAKILSGNNHFSSVNLETQNKKKKAGSRIIRGIEEYIAEGAIVTDSADVVLESGKYIIQNEFSF